MTRSFAEAVRVAWSGVRRGVREERNLRILFTLAGIVAFAAAALQLRLLYVGLTIVITAVVVTAEYLNAAIERTVDIASPGILPLAGAAKDLAAGGVLIAAALAVPAGLAVFAAGIAAGPEPEPAARALAIGLAVLTGVGALGMLLAGRGGSPPSQGLPGV